MTVSPRFCPAEFPDNQNTDKTLPAPPPHQSIFATTKFQQNLEILTFASMWCDVFSWEKITCFNLSRSDLFVRFAPGECFVLPDPIHAREMFHKHLARFFSSCTPKRGSCDHCLLAPSGRLTKAADQNEDFLVFGHLQEPLHPRRVTWSLGWVHPAPI